MPTITRNTTLHTVQYDTKNSPLFRHLMEHSDTIGCFYRGSHRLLDVMALVATGKEIESKPEMKTALETLSKQARILIAPGANGNTAKILATLHGFDTKSADANPGAWGEALEENDPHYPVTAKFQHTHKNRTIRKWLNKETGHEYTAWLACNMIIKRRERTRYPDQNDPHLIGKPGAWKEIIDHMIGRSKRNPQGLQNRAAFIAATMNDAEETSFTPAQIAEFIKKRFPDHQLVVFHTQEENPAKNPHQPMTNMNTIIAILPKTQLNLLERNGRITRTECRITA